jgi:hypothetical protein
MTMDNNNGERERFLHAYPLAAHCFVIFAHSNVFALLFNASIKLQLIFYYMVCVENERKIRMKLMRRKRQTDKD